MKAHNGIFARGPGTSANLHSVKMVHLQLEFTLQK